MATHTTQYREELYIDGGWHPAAETIPVTDLSEDEVLTEISAASTEDAERALGAAAAAKPAMRELSVVQRADWMNAIAAEIESHAEMLAETIVREAGKPISSARGEVESAAERFRRAAQEARSLSGEFLEGTTDGHEGWQALVRKEPVGVVLCITPYNYPLSTTALQVAPALAAGNAVVLKPASKTPLSAALLTEIVVDTAPELPAGGMAFVPGRASAIGDTLVGDDRVDAIAMTGSSPAGKHIAETSGMVRLHMELGGNAPLVVFPDADVGAVAQAATSGSLKYAGQRCSAVSRLLVHRSVHDEVIEQVADRMDAYVAGDLFDPETKLGPLISMDQADWVQELVDDAVDRGATVVTGGQRDGRFYAPTLLAEVPHDARIVHEEQFGPVVVVTSVADEAEAIALANEGELGLDAAVFTSDYDRAMRVADRLQAGGVRINGAPSHGIGDIPFGGVGDSGIGREGIGKSIEAFLTSKTIVL